MTATQVGKHTSESARTLYKLDKVTGYKKNNVTVGCYYKDILRPVA